MEIKNKDQLPDSSSPLKVYRNVKVRLNAFMDRVIQRCNSILGNEEELGQSFQGTVVLKFAWFIGSLARLLQQFARAEAYYIISPAGRVIYVGTEHGADTFQNLYDKSSDAPLQSFGRFKVWNLPSLAKQWLLNDVEMVVCEFSPLFPFRFSTAFVVSSPELIEQEISLPENLDDFCNRSNFRVVRQKLNRSRRRAQFESYFTHEKSDFDLYYYKMYLPYITQRHGKAAAITSYDGALENFNRGGLMMVKEDQKPVAGMMFIPKEQTCFGLEAGILEGNKDLIRKEVYTFNIWSVFEWTSKHGLAKLNMGAGSAWRSNGVFSYKKDWGARARRFRSIQNDLFYLMEKPSEEFLEYLNEKGVITEDNGKYYGVIFSQGNTQSEADWLETELSEAMKDGLSGIMIVSPNSKVVFGGNAEIKNCEE